MFSHDCCNAGIALRVPTPNVSVVDLVIQTEKKTFAEEVNEAFREYARGPQKVTFHLPLFCLCPLHIVSEPRGLECV